MKRLLTKSKLKEIIKEEIQRLNESVDTLYVYATTPNDHKKFKKWLSKSEFYGEEFRNDYFKFDVSDQHDADSLEREIDKSINKLNISVRYEVE